MKKFILSFAVCCLLFGFMPTNIFANNEQMPNEGEMSVALQVLPHFIEPNTPEITSSDIQNPVVDIAVNSLYLRDNLTSMQYSFDNTLWIDYTGEVTIHGTTTENFVQLQSGVHNITLDGVSINTTTASEAAFDIQGDATANITLKDDSVNTLTSKGSFAGLQVQHKNGSIATLNITDLGNGSLVATGSFGGAGIGGGHSVSAGIVTIAGGIVTAIGKDTGSGIGGGVYGAGATVTISGGTVIATSAGATAIGSGNNSTNYGSFTTTAADGTKGNAFIVASTSSNNRKIGDTSKIGEWQGIIFEGNVGHVYGSPTLSVNAEIPNGKTLTVETNRNFTIDVAATLTNNGTLINDGTFINDGTLTGSGVLDGNGIFQTTRLEPGNIVLQNSYEYTGIPITVTPTISGGIIAMGKMFNAVDTGWTYFCEINNAGTWQNSTVQEIGDYRFRYQKTGMYDVTQSFVVTNDLRRGGDFPYNPIGTLNKDDSSLPDGTSLKDEGTVIITNLILDKFKAEAKNLAMSEEIVYIHDLELVNTADDSDATPDAQTRIRIDVPGLLSIDKAWVLHELADGSIEKYEAECYNGYLLFTPTSFSVYSVVVDWASRGGSSTHNPSIAPLTGVYN